MRPTNSPFPLGWHCPTCRQSCRSLELLCPGCLTPRPLVPAPLLARLLGQDQKPGGRGLADLLAPGLQPTADLVASLDAWVAAFGRRAPEAASLVEPWLERLTGLARQWGDRLPLMLDDASPHVQHLHRRLATWLEGFAPVAVTVVERLRENALDPARLDQLLRDLVAALQGLLERLDDVAHRRAGLDELRRQLHDVVGLLLPLVGLR